MARVTVEDCVTKIPNRFRLVMLAAQRARNLSVGSPLTVERDDDKNPVVSLREIADGTVDVEELEEALIVGLQKHVESDETEEDTTELLAMEEELAAAAGNTMMADDVSVEELAAEDLGELVEDPEAKAAVADDSAVPDITIAKPETGPDTDFNPETEEG